MSSWVVAPFSAARAAADFRTPWAEHWGKPASLQRSRNQFPKPAAEKGLPNCVTKKVVVPMTGDVSMVSRSASAIGRSTSTFVLARLY